MVIQAYDSEDKLRPGVYIKTVVEPSNNVTTTGKGATAIGLQMDWGDEGKLIECNQTDYFAGNCKSQLGYSLSNTEKLLPFTLALSNCYKAYFYRLNQGGVKATIDVGDVTFTAKYTGIVGNNIKVVIAADTPSTGKYTFSIYLDSVKEESYILSKVDDFKEITSKWIDITVADGATSITATAGATLTGGTNGTVGATALADFFDSLNYTHIDTIAINDATTESQKTLADWAVEQNANGKEFQAVVIDQLLDNESIISTYNQGYKTSTYEVTPELLTILIAGARAGCQLNASLAGKTISDATTITNPVTENAQIELLLKSGYFLLTYDIDGTVCIEEDQNSLVTYNDNKPEDMKYNQVVAVKSFINYQTAMVFRNYIGKFTNIDTVRKNIKSDIITTVYDYLLTLGAIEEYDSDSDITIEKKDNRSALVNEFFQVAQTLTKLFVINHLKF